VASLVGTAANAPSYANVDSGWTAKSVGAADNSTSNFNNSAAGLPDPAATSMLMIIVANVTLAPAAARSLGRIASGASASIEPRINATPVNSLLSGAASANGIKNPTTFGWQPYVVQNDVTNSIQRMITAQEVIKAASFTALSTKNIQLFRTATNAPQAHANLWLVFSGTTAEAPLWKWRKALYWMMNNTEQLWI